MASVASYKKKIEQIMRNKGTYSEDYQIAIDALAAILHDIDTATAQYKRTKSSPVIMYTNKAGARNPVKNPILATIQGLRQDAIVYMRELGITPAGAKRIGDNVVNKRVSGVTVSFETLMDDD